MNECIFCRDRLIKYLKQRRVYWFCVSCFQEMPNPSGYPLNSSKAHNQKLPRRNNG